MREHELVYYTHRLISDVTRRSQGPFTHLCRAGRGRKRAKVTLSPAKTTVLHFRYWSERNSSNNNFLYLHNTATYGLRPAHRKIPSHRETSKPTEGEVPPAGCAGVVCANKTNKKKTKWRAFSLLRIAEERARRGGGRGNIQHAARTQQPYNIKFKKRKAGFLPVIGKGITCLIWFGGAIQIPRHVRSIRPNPTLIMNALGERGRPEAGGDTPTQRGDVQKSEYKQCTTK